MIEGLRHNICGEVEEGDLLLPTIKHARHRISLFRRHDVCRFSKESIFVLLQLMKLDLDSDLNYLIAFKKIKPHDNKKKG